MTVDPQDIIDNAIIIANEAVANANDSADYILDLTSGKSTSYTSFKPNDLITAVEPIIADAGSGKFTYEVQLDKLVNLLTTELANYFSTYYPLDSDAFDDATNWLINTITNGGTGIPKEVEDQIWQRNRDRIVTEGRRVENQILTSSASRGDVLPSGAMNAQIREVWYQQQSANGVASTSVAQKQAEIEIENIRFAVTGAIDSRFKALNAANSYIGALMSAPALATDVASMDSGQEAEIANATANLYRARLSRDEIIINSEVAQMNSQVDFQRFVHSDLSEAIDLRVRGAISAGDIYGKVASGSLSAMNSIASTSTSAFV